MNRILAIVGESIKHITNSRFYQTERGFQGELLSQLRIRLPTLENEEMIIEQEYQKRMREHGFKKRPDLILHIPYDSKTHSSRSEGNFAVIEIKKRADAKSAIEDYLKLDNMCKSLNYLLGVFINIDSDQTHYSIFESEMKRRLFAYAVRLKGNEVIFHMDGCKTSN